MRLERIVHPLSAGMGFNGLNCPQNRVPLAAVLSHSLPYCHILIIVIIIDFVKGKLQKDQYFFTENILPKPV
jgi:hypothetical protein